MNRGIAEAPPESGFIRVTESRILVVQRGDTETNRTVDDQAAVTGCETSSVARSSLAPLRRLITRLSHRRAESRGKQRIGIENRVAVNTEPFRHGYAACWHWQSVRSVGQIGFRVFWLRLLKLVGQWCVGFYGGRFFLSARAISRS